MLPTHQYVKSHHGFEIFQRMPGFEFTPVTLGKIASYIIRDEDGGIAVAAFMYSMLIALEGESVDENALLAAAVSTIERYIDDGKISNRVELTFEHASGKYVEVRNPQWWIAAFR